MSRGGLLSRETAKRLDDLLTDLKSRLAQAEEKIRVLSGTHQFRPQVQRVINTSGAAIEQFRPVRLADVFESDPRRFHWHRSEAKAINADYAVFGIAAQHITKGGAGFVYTSGICPAWITDSHSSHDRCDVRNATTTLQSGYAGAARIITRNLKGVTNLALVQLGELCDVTVRATASGTINPGATNATVSVPGGTTITGVSFDWIDAGGLISNNKELYVQFVAFEKKWRIVNADCE